MDTLSVTFLGQCGFLITDGHTRVVTDPYLSDAVDQKYHSEATPWRRLYPAPYTLSELNPDLVLISHAHTDHLDPLTLGAYAKAGGKAPVAAPAPECGQVESLSLTAIRARAEQPFAVGGATVTPLPCAHTEFHMDEEGRFRELSYLIEFPCGAVFFGGDMSLYDGLTERVKRARVCLCLLPVNGRDAYRTSHGIIGNTTAREAAEFARAVSAPYVPMHHDLYDINGCPVETAVHEARETGANIASLAPGASLTIRDGVIA